MAKHPTDSTRPSRTQTARRPITLELAATVCPNAQIAANIARHFALDTVDYDAVREVSTITVSDGSLIATFDGLPGSASRVL